MLDPLKVTITNYPKDTVEERAYPIIPTDPSKGENKVPFCSTIYTDRSDFREKDEPDYYRLAPGKEVGLSRGYNITCNKLVYGPDGRVSELLCTYDPKSTRKPKAHIHWYIFIFIFSRLFTERRRFFFFFLFVCLFVCLFESQGRTRTAQPVTHPRRGAHVLEPVQVCQP